MNPLGALVTEAQGTVPELLAARARTTPDATFLRWERQTWTYAEAWDASRRFAGWLGHEAGLGAGDRVAAYLPNRPEMLWTWFGTLAAGGVFVPLNRGHRGAILEDMVARSRARVMVTDRTGTSELQRLGREALVVDADRLPAVAPAEAATPAPGDVAEILYTSGTTGRSKAVPLTHEHLCRGAGWVAWALELSESDVFHAWMPLFHVAAQIDCVLPAIVAGGSCALYPGFSRSAYWDQVADSGATIFTGFSNVGELLLSLPESERDRGSSFRLGLMGAMSADLRGRFQARFGFPLVDIFGMTEAEPITLPRPGRACPAGSCGQASPDFEIAVLDEHGLPVTAGDVGELACRPRRPNVLTPGYEGDVEAMLAATRGLWFHTGDLVYTDEDGFIFWVDRKKHVIRCRGENVSSFELESAVLRHPDVEECCVLGVPAPLGGDDVKLVVAPAEGRAIDPGALRAWCAERMAPFMVPRYVEIRERLPRMATGKVLRTGLESITAATWDAAREIVAR